MKCAAWSVIEKLNVKMSGMLFFIELTVGFVFYSWLKTCQLLLFEPSGRKSKNFTSTSSHSKRRKRPAGMEME